MFLKRLLPALLPPAQTSPVRPAAWLAIARFSAEVLPFASLGGLTFTKSAPRHKATPAAPYYHSGIRVENCSFTSRNALYMRYTDKMTFVGNSCSAGGKFSFFLDNCGSLETDCDADVKRVSTKSSRDE